MSRSLSRSLASLTFGPVIALSVIACGGGAPDIAGVYQVTSHTRNQGDCVNEGAAVTDYNYFGPGRIQTK